MGIARAGSSVVSCWLAAVVCGSAVAQPQPPALSRLDFREVIRHAKAEVFPAVVYIKVVREATERGKQGSQQVAGSGVIISPDGEMITNWHVVDKAITVRCLLSDGRAMAAEIVGSDKDTDIALLQLKKPVDDGPLPYAHFGDSTVLMEGDFVMAMGAPFGLNRSVSIGIISCTERYLSGASEYSLWLQTDSAINPGNSGGPLVNTDGQIIGLNARGIGFADGMGFAIPSETILQLLPQLREHGQVNWSWTGLQFQPLHDFDRDIYFDETEGIIIAETDPESPARRAGIHARDRIRAVNGRLITGMTEEALPDIRRLFGLLPQGEPITLDVVRGGELLTIELTPREKGQVEGDELVCERWGLTVKTINQFANANLYFHRKQGVFVYGLKYPGNATSAGLRRNDIIVKMEGKTVTRLEEVEAIYDEAIANIDQKHRMLFVLLRNGLMRQVVLDYLRDYERE